MNTRQKQIMLTLAGIAMALAGIAIWVFTQSRFRLPFAPRFAPKQMSEWTPYGGSWTLEQNAVIAQSLERGAKLVTGSDSWTDYQLDVDVQLRGHGGDIGIAVRVNQPTIGIDAYRGYYAGIRFDDSAIVIGRSDSHWLMTSNVPIAGGVTTQQWYHLHIVAVGCKVLVEVTNPSTGATSYAGLVDRPSRCIRSGKIALRETAANGGWKNLLVRAATDADLNPLAAHIPNLEDPLYPIREREFSAMRERYFNNAIVDKIDGNGEDRGTSLSPDSNAAPLVQVDELRPYLWNDKPVRIVGVITSTAPFYIQDATAGIRLDSSHIASLQVGDEVELLGRPTLVSDALRFASAESRILWDRVPLVPLSVTATQAAGGRYDGSLIELSGTLRKRSTLPNGDSALLLQDGEQLFSMLVPYDLFSADTLHFEAGSRLRVRGICVAVVGNSGSFTLFASSPTDVVLVSGPPWWSGQRLVWSIVGLAAAIVIAVYLFIAVERSKLRVVHQERERLSHDMHDTLAQSLAGVGFKLQGIRRSMRASGAIPRTIIEEIDTTCEMVAGTHREASASIAALHPASQNDGDLLTLLERSVFSMLDGDGIEVQTHREGDARNMSPVISDTLFRIGREAIANVLRHSRATSISIAITYRLRDLTLSITDNGSGFAFDPAKRGFGLRSIERRCDDINARVEVFSRPDEGCTVRVTSPYRSHRILSRWIG